MAVPNTLLRYLKSELSQIGMNETVYQKAFKTHFLIAQVKVKNFQETVSFHLASNHSNYLNQMYLKSHFL